ncbi:ribosomal RNA small subunit methyltransferase, chloroplastic-like isoform X1 [Salvia splendens]|uniref:ribosomal RNA small subunit methyltransferase, chloroplastic-like isoform X1 n=1 Tax=Salvia splendens TaxID=180675 RepID=UPI001C25F493|nr:ribosomal RNA small subunit methyltransferase, chloroplastic-like isoform X1 [Salvia splendens]
MSSLFRPILTFHQTRTHDILAAGAVPRLQASGTTSKGKPVRQQDDYHSTLKALKSKGRFPRKSLGQHYMVNGSVNEELVVAANVKQGDVVLEIGPGTGSLTNVLVEAGATVLAIEKSTPWRHVWD